MKRQEAARIALLAIIELDKGNSPAGDSEQQKAWWNAVAGYEINQSDYGLIRAEIEKIRAK